MFDADTRDRKTTHSVLNLLMAEYQGVFAMQNVLRRLGDSSVTDQMLQECRTALQKVSLWSERMWRQEYLFSGAWSSAETFEAKEALALLMRLKPDLFVVANSVGALLSNPNVANEHYDLIYLAASFARYAYSRENYLKGLIKYAGSAELVQEADTLAPLLREAESDISFAHFHISNLEKSSGYDKDTVLQLLERCYSLPATFRTHIHEINQINALFSGGLTFALADFTADEIKEWEGEKINPAIAGYWRAAGFGANESARWLEIGVPSATFAITWKLHGFDATSAAAWVRELFSPQEALEWGSANYDPVSARTLQAQGISAKDAPKR